MKHAPGFLKLAEEAKAVVPQKTIEDVKPRLNEQGKLPGEDFYLIDVREDHEWNKGHLPGAMHLGRGIIERDIENLIPDTSAEIILYCGGGFRSSMAGENLQKLGYTNVASMDGGYRAWTEAGYPVSLDNPK